VDRTIKLPFSKAPTQFTSYEDLPTMGSMLPQALALDRAASLEALGKQRTLDEQALDELRGGVTRGREALGEASQSVESKAQGDLEPYRQQQAQLQEQRLGMLDQMQGQIDQITQEYVQATTNLRDEALNALESQAPEQAEQAIRTLSKNATEKKSNIVNQYAQMGLGQDHPAVQAALQRVDDQTMASTSDVWQRAAIAHNSLQTQVRSNYDNYIQAAEGGRASARLSGVSQTQQGILQAQEANRAFAALEANVRQSVSNMQTQLAAQAAQLEIQGSQAMADMIRDQTIAWSPIAPLIAAQISLNDNPTGTQITSASLPTPFSGAPDPLASLGGGTSYSNSSRKKSSGGGGQNRSSGNQSGGGQTGVPYWAGNNPLGDRNFA
jgi:hypothetical protein